MRSTLRFGVLGCAEFALRRMLPAIAATPGCVIEAIASRDPARARDIAARYRCRSSPGYSELLEDDRVDAVYIPVPAALHAPWTEAALIAGKHVLVEKPLALDAGRAAELITLARQRGAALAENVLFPHHSQHAAVRDLVAAGAIGRVRGVEAVFAIPRRSPGDIRLQADLGGGALWDTGVYPLYAVRHLLGTGLRVVAAARTDDPHCGVDIAGTALLVDARGVSATAVFGLDHAYRNEYAVWGSEGRIIVRRAFTPPPDMRPDVRIERGATSEHVPMQAEDQAVAAVAAFAAAARHRRPSEPAELLEQARLRDAVRRAADATAEQAAIDSRRSA
jgi:dTDP-3,4-didehydro-2,6-dideoxy-alpha-D-glucose 3-reductase